MTAWRLTFLAAALAGTAIAAQADDDLTPALASIEDRWTAVRYEIKTDPQKLAAVHDLERDAAALMQAHPLSVEARVWYALTLLAEADVRHNASALPLVREARGLLEEAQAQPSTMQVQILNALGDLYAQVPGWPIGFGDKKKAGELLQKALAINPRGIDPNFFYGEYLVETKRPEEAVAYLERALQAPARPGRQIADAGRREEARTLLDRIKAK